MEISPIPLVESPMTEQQMNDLGEAVLVVQDIEITKSGDEM